MADNLMGGMDVLPFNQEDYVSVRPSDRVFNTGGGIRVADGWTVATWPRVGDDFVGAFLKAIS